MVFGFGHKFKELLEALKTDESNEEEDRAITLANQIQEEFGRGLAIDFQSLHQK